MSCWLQSSDVEDIEDVTCDMSNHPHELGITQRCSEGNAQAL